jgi:hypothetical protein
VAEEEVEMEPRDPQEHPDLLQIRGRRVHLDLQDHRVKTAQKVREEFRDHLDLRDRKACKEYRDQQEDLQDLRDFGEWTES